MHTHTYIHTYIDTHTLIHLHELLEKHYPIEFWCYDIFNVKMKLEWLI
jgi:hypothetical protein